MNRLPGKTKKEWPLVVAMGSARDPREVRERSARGTREVRDRSAKVRERSAKVRDPK